MTSGHPVRHKQQRTGQHQGKRDKKGVLIQQLHAVLDGEHQQQRQSGHNDHQNHTAGRNIRRLALGQLAQMNHAEKLPQQLTNIPAVRKEHGHQRAQVQQHVEKHVVMLHIGQLKKMLKQRQVSRAGDGQELRDALHQTQNDGRDVTHEISSCSCL